MANQLQIADDLSLPLDVLTETVAILAKRRVGKSYTARKLVEQLLAAALQVVIIDPKGDWWGLRSSADGKRPGYQILIAGGEHGDVPIEAAGGEVLARFVVEQRPNLLLDVSSFRKHEVATFMSGFLEALYRLKAREEFRTPVMLVIDEADAIGPQRPQKGEERMLGAAEDIVRRGGQRGLGTMLITQRSAVLNKNLLTQAQILVALRTMSPQDLAALDAWIEVHGSREERQVLFASLPSLPVGDAWVWSPGWPTAGGIFQRIHVAPIETFDSGATPKVGQKVIPPKSVAEVDLGALKVSLASTIEKAKADDPRELRKRIVELERQVAKERDEYLRQLQTRDKQLEAKTQTVEVEKIVEVPVLAPELAADLREVAEQLQAIGARITVASAQIVVGLNGITTNKPPAARPEATPVPRTNPVPREHQRPPPHSAAPRPELPARNTNLSTPQQRILDALASFEAAGLRDVAKSNAAAFADQSSLSSGFRNNLSALRTRGLIEYPASGRVALTEAGRASAAPTDPIHSLAQLHAAWRAKLSGPQWRMLEVLIASYPEVVPREELAERAFQSAASSGYRNNLSALRSLGLIDYPSAGQVVATELLFPALS